MMEALAYIALGSNLGDRARNLAEAVKRMDSHPGIRLAAMSDIYETEPVGPVRQDDFLNAVAAVRTNLEPEPLLDALLAIEAEMGRVREIRWGPRTIDLDVLLYENIICNTPRLTIPHPHMGDRAFVLIPLVDCMDKLKRPEAESWRERLETLIGKETVRRWTDNR
ncbi:2-amino-4-hydroxy-6-hydroxymethyldihydropteridine diphosphokinase [Paenibacillus thermoaerophilus]|uniref:2-amino-4-hydroxy-6-hydroxymethyldihydropteridine diphosphokinase n=1 Tax=Paenibacillus thermoaerophilus TaxID=1215385 RepID=A0ABW2V2S8_9BACL|nr:2-amino-4-hydroxy-6-hydroxymethyldihydropteridine diphosphokinase [Paenibacillus thermoaerophilus]